MSLMNGGELGEGVECGGPERERESLMGRKCFGKYRCRREENENWYLRKVV
jgi:hypothetical protein